MDWTMIQYALPLFIVVIGLEKKSLNMVGAITGLLMAYILLLTQNIYWFFIMFSFLVIGMLATRYKEEKKEKLKLIQKIRGSKNAMANGGIGILMALLGGPVAAYGFIGAISAATADTVSSEMGVTSKEKPVMITNFKKAKAGVNGAISFFGTSLGLLASLAIGMIALTIVPFPKAVIIALIAGLAGNLADSWLGAVFENRGWWGNSTTNLFATTVGAIAGMLIGIAI